MKSWVIKNFVGIFVYTIAALSCIAMVSCMIYEFKNVEPLDVSFLEDNVASIELTDEMVEAYVALVYSGVD